MSKTTEHLIPPSMHLTPKHVDAMHLIKLFVREYEDRNLYYRPEILDPFYHQCKNFGF
tara:strand:- start:1251 stop:1424 length:174 start_codon:yes stop_codon:yes gene_type:complete